MRKNPEPSEVRQARAKARMTQVQLAECLGVTARTVQRWESGASRMPHAAWLILKQAAETQSHQQG